MSFYNKYKWLMPMQLFIAMLLAGRVAYTKTSVFIFIPWNLFLALVPLYLSYRVCKARTKVAQLLYLATWLLFFPNATYIITDMFHLRQRGGIPEWYDLLILFSAAASGLIMGFLSLQQVEEYLHGQLSRKYMALVLPAVFILCGYGVYLGRYLRWNSWDIVAQPLQLGQDVLAQLIHQLRNMECWMLSMLFGTWMFIAYTYFKKMRQKTTCI